MLSFLKFIFIACSLVLFTLLAGVSFVRWTVNLFSDPPVTIFLWVFGTLLVCIILLALDYFFSRSRVAMLDEEIPEEKMQYSVFFFVLILLSYGVGSLESAKWYAEHFDFIMRLATDYMFPGLLLLLIVNVVGAHYLTMWVTDDFRGFGRSLWNKVFSRASAP